MKKPTPRPPLPEAAAEDSQTPAFANDRMLSEEVHRILKALPGPQQKVLLSILTDDSFQRLWQWPLPPPDLLKEYNEAFPNAAERIFDEMQRQTTHRIELEKRWFPEQQLQSKRGQIFGLIVAMSFLAAAFLLISMGYGIYGTIIGSIDIVALVTVFVIGRREQMRYLESLKTP